VLFIETHLLLKFGTEVFLSEKNPSLQVSVQYFIHPSFCASPQCQLWLCADNFLSCKQLLHNPVRFF